MTPSYDEGRLRPIRNLMGAKVELPEVEERQPDKFRCEISPGLAVVTDASGCIVLETNLALIRHTVTDVATLVVALETARDVGNGGPSQGSPMQRATQQLAELAAWVEGDLARLHLSGRLLTDAVTQQVRQVWADLRYGPLPAEWLEWPESHAAMCTTCLVFCRRPDGGPAVLRHRPGCPEGGGHD